MVLNIRKIILLLKDVFGDNVTQMAKTLGVSRSHLNKVIKNEGKGAGSTICGAIIKYCEKNGLDFHDYIFLV